MALDRLPYRDIRPTWGRPSSQMTVRYVSHPDLRIGFIQVPFDPEMVYVVTDEPLPADTDQAMAMVEKWRLDNGQATA